LLSVAAVARGQTNVSQLFDAAVIKALTGNPLPNATGAFPPSPVADAVPTEVPAPESEINAPQRSQPALASNQRMASFATSLDPLAALPFSARPVASSTGDATLAPPSSSPTVNANPNSDDQALGISDITKPLRVPEDQAAAQTPQGAQQQVPAYALMSSQMAACVDDQIGAAPDVSAKSPSDSGHRSASQADAATLQSSQCPSPLRVAAWQISRKKISTAVTTSAIAGEAAHPAGSGHDSGRAAEPVPLGARSDSSVSDPAAATQEASPSSRDELALGAAQMEAVALEPAASLKLTIPVDVPDIGLTVASDTDRAIPTAAAYADASTRTEPTRMHLTVAILGAGGAAARGPRPGTPEQPAMDWAGADGPATQAGDASTQPLLLRARLAQASVLGQPQGAALGEAFQTAGSPEAITPDSIVTTAASTATPVVDTFLATAAVAPFKGDTESLPSHPAATTAGAAYHHFPTAQLTPALMQLGHAIDGAQRLTVRLDPPELGHVQIKIDRPLDAPARVEITVEKPETLNLLLRDQPALQRALDQAGVPADGRNVTFHVATPEPSLRSDPGTSPVPNTSAGGLTGEGSHDASRQHPQSARRQHDPVGNDGEFTSIAASGWMRAGLDITA